MLVFIYVRSKVETYRQIESLVITSMSAPIVSKNSMKHFTRSGTHGLSSINDIQTYIQIYNSDG